MKEIDRTMERLPDDWRAEIAKSLSPDQIEEAECLANVDFDDGCAVYPPVGRRFEALRCTPLEQVRAVILGQDPYHEADQAHGLAFSTKAAKWPPSLRNIICEWHVDTGLPCPPVGSLEAWARHGVLLLNTALSVRDGVASSHGKPWQLLTTAIIDAVNSIPEPIAFLLWGAPAIKKGEGIDRRHVVVRSSHPSPLSADRPCGSEKAFIGSRPFTTVNRDLTKPIDWSLE